jgi:hypothetical protein
MQPAYQPSLWRVFVPLLPWALIALALWGIVHFLFHG